MPNILAFDTATHACSVAMQIGDLTLDDHRIIPRQHSQQLLPMIEALLQRDDLAMTDLEAIACGVGPGSFMGVRLAVSVAQGLAYGAAKPVVGVSTLQILAQTAYEQYGFERVVAAWDARMDELYWGAYVLRDGIMMAEVTDQLSKPSAWQFDSADSWQLVGNAWAEYADRFTLADNFVRSGEGDALYPEAKSLLTIASKQYATGNAVAATDLQPNYIRNQVTS